MAKVKNILGSGEKVSLQNIEYDFVTLASHQLRTPLSAVKWFCEILLGKRAGKLTKKQEDYLREIYRSNERAIGLVNDLLDVSRIQEGKIHLEIRPLQVQKIIEEIIDSHGTLIKSAGINIDFEIVSGPLPMVETDPDKLKRVMVNLLTNILISVADTGVGIPKNEQDRVFQRFFRSRNVIKLSPDGTGLGLFIAKSLVQTMGGKISFISEEGKGTTFVFSLPIKN